MISIGVSWNRLFTLRFFPDYSADMIGNTDLVSSEWRDNQIVDLLVESRKIALLIIMQSLLACKPGTISRRFGSPYLKTSSTSLPEHGYFGGACLARIQEAFSSLE